MHDKHALLLNADASIGEALRDLCQANPATLSIRSYRLDPAPVNILPAARPAVKRQPHRPAGGRSKYRPHTGAKEAARAARKAIGAADAFTVDVLKIVPDRDEIWAATGEYPPAGYVMIVTGLPGGRPVEDVVSREFVTDHDIRPGDKLTYWRKGNRVGLAIHIDERSTDSKPVVFDDAG